MSYHLGKPRNFQREWILTFAVITIAFALTSTTLAQTKDINKSRLRTAQDLERRGSYDNALRIYRSLYDLVPRNQLYYEGLKRNMVRLKKFDELVVIIKTQINMSKGNNNPRFWADLGNVYYKRGDQAQAMSIWETVLADDPRQKSGYIYVANAMVQNRLYDQAIEVYQNARQAFGQQHLFVFELANIYVLRLKYREATLEYLSYLEKNPKQFSYIESRITGYTKDPEHTPEVAEVLKSSIPQSKQAYLVRKLLANLYLRVEDFEKALQQFKFLETVKVPTSQKKQGQELYFFAEKSLRAGQYQFAQDAFELILTNYNKSPYRPRAFYGIAISRQMRGLSAEALTSYNELIEAFPTTRWVQDALFQIGEIYFQDLFELDQALKTFHLLIQKYPNSKNSVQAHFRIGDCYAAQGDFEKAQLWYDRTRSLGTANPPARDEALFSSANLDFMQGEFDTALEKLHKITEKIAQRKGEQPFVNDALELTFLIEENQAESKEALVVYGQAQKHRVQRKLADAIKALQEIVSNYPTASILDESLFDLGEIESERGNYAVAIGYFQGLLDDHPESLQNELGQKRIAEVYETGLGDNQKAYQAYEQLLIKYPNSVYLEEVRQKLRELLSKRLSN